MSFFQQFNLFVFQGLGVWGKELFNLLILNSEWQCLYPKWRGGFLKAKNLGTYLFDWFRFNQTITLLLIQNKQCSWIQISKTGDGPIKIYSINSTLSNFFKHSDWLKILSNQSKCLKKYRGLNLRCKFALGLGTGGLPYSDTSSYKVIEYCLSLRSPWNIIETIFQRKPNTVSRKPSVIRRARETLRSAVTYLFNFKYFFFTRTNL